MNGSEVHIDIYDDRMEIYSSGGMPDGSIIQDRDPLTVPSTRRTPVLADIFNRLGYMERKGSGFGKIIGGYEFQINYDESKVEKTEISGKTIMVDPANFFLRNLGSVNNTIIHECVHWEKHRKAFELERLYNKDATFIRCQTVGGVKENKVRSATDWMEWQANAIAPRIQMPSIAFKEKTREFIQRCRQEAGNVAIVDVLEWVIDSLATFFVVSREAAKIRLYDIGYDEVLGVFNYVDGRYVRPHSFKGKSGLYSSSGGIK